MQRAPLSPSASFIAGSILASAVGPLISLVDTAVGARISSQDLAGLVLGSSLAGGIGWVVMQLIGGLPGVLGRLEGAERRQDVARLGGEAVLAAAAIGLLLIVPIAAGLEGLCQFMAERDATSEGAAHYIGLRLLGLPLILVFQVLVAILRNVEKNAWTPLWATCGILLANGACDVLFCLYLPLGLGGLALASAVTPLIGIMLCWRRLRQQSLLDFSNQWSAIREQRLSSGLSLSLSLGGTALLRGCLLNLTLIATSILAERFGTEALGAHGLALQMWLLIAFSIDGFALAGQAYGSHLLGSGDRKATRQLAWRLYRLCLLGAGALGLVLYGLWDWLPVLFALDGSAHLAFAELALPLLVQIPLGVGAFVSDGMLQGAGDQKFLAWQMGAASLLGFPLALLSVPFNLPNLWWAVAFWLLIRMALGTARLAGDGWLELSDRQMSSMVDASKHATNDTSAAG
ncbi:MAG: hypothetical protein CMH50_05250 [Myxococcales bacterium]|nr:hypothetical protein [Myxococcales bacterium]